LIQKIAKETGQWHLLQGSKKIDEGKGGVLKSHLRDAEQEAGVKTRHPHAKTGAEHATSVKT